MHPFPTAQFFAELSAKKFDALPKTAKPLPTEWTVLSTIIQFDNTTNKSKVVALGCGTKCIGHGDYCSFGMIVNDSHGEVLARRAFLRYIYSELGKANGIFAYNEDNKCFQLKSGISFHFFTSKLPCGDACIVEKVDEEPPVSKRIKLETNDDKAKEDVGEIYAVTEPINTGAKVFSPDPDSVSDPMDQQPGAIRTKPGRGVRTLSLSCSDKISRWTFVGIQGALLRLLLEEPIYIQTYNMGCEFNKDSVERAIYGRWSESYEFQSFKDLIVLPEIRGSTENPFKHSQTEGKKPCPNAQYWADVPEDQKPFEAGTDGKRLGVNKRNYYKKKSSLQISRTFLLDSFCAIVTSKPELMAKLGLNDESIKTTTYADLKNLSTSYQETWNFVVENFFGQWVKKHKSLQSFNLNNAYNFQ